MSNGKNVSMYKELWNIDSNLNSFSVDGCRELIDLNTLMNSIYTCHEMNR